MRCCSYKFCYYHHAVNIERDCIEINTKCDGCSEVWYHTKACKNWDKDHQGKCIGLNSQKIIPKKQQSSSRQKPNFNNKENISIKPPIVNFTDNNQSNINKFEYTNKSKRIILNNYEIFDTKVLGEGSYGKVVLGKECLTNNDVAVKIVNKEVLVKKAQTNLQQREIYIQQKLKYFLG